MYHRVVVWIVDRVHSVHQRINRKRPRGRTLDGVVQHLQYDIRPSDSVAHIPK